MTRKVLIIEDDRDIAALIKMHLTDIDCQCEIVTDGTKGLATYQSVVKTQPFDLVVLDLMLPGMDGLEICRAIRREEHYVPVLMLTAKSTELDRVLGLEIGADDYLTKPFSIPELQARIKALFRRVEALSHAASSPPVQRIITHEGLRLDSGSPSTIYRRSTR